MLPPDHPCDTTVRAFNVHLSTMNSHSKLAARGVLLTTALAMLTNGCRSRADRTAASQPIHSAAPSMNADIVTDPYLWLEDVTGEKALDWVRQQNAASTNELEASPDFAPIRQQ